MTVPSSWEEDKNVLFFNPYSAAWKPNSPAGIGMGSCGKGFMYGAGMIGYAFAIPSRLVGIVKDLLMLIKALFLPCTNGKGELDLRVKALRGSLLEVPIAVIGIICPPIAYRLDESYARMAQEYGFLKYCITITLTL